MHPPNNEHTDDEMLKIEVNLDDIPGEWLGHVMDLLFRAGATDVFYSPIYMKKNRPGVLLQLLCSKNDFDAMKEILLSETTTLGFRYYPITVQRMERRFIKVNTKWGAITVKQGIYKGEVFQQSPEYDECKSIADKYGVPLKKYMRRFGNSCRELIFTQRIVFPNQGE